MIRVDKKLINARNVNDKSFSVKVSCHKKHEKMTFIQYSFVAATRLLNFIV